MTPCPRGRQPNDIAAPDPHTAKLVEVYRAVTDRKLLEAVIHRFDGGPAGLDNVAAAIGEEPARPRM